MRCPACAFAAPDAAKFCPECGVALSVKSAARPPAGDETVLSADPQATVLSARGASVAHDANTPYAAGTVLAGRYRVERVLGRGGMGIVYLAHDERLGHSVALKFLPPSLARDRRRLDQFHSEVRLARQISHPNVCRVYDIGDDAGAMYLSMEYVDGDDLGALLRSGRRFGEAEGVELARQIAAGLAAVHAQGVLHRDLKPANIMVSRDGHARLMDFGIAASGHIDAAERVTEGTPLYMAPEQLSGSAASAQTDIYAFGLVLYEIFTGRRLQDAATLGELRSRHDLQAAAASTALDGKVEPRIRAAVVQCLDHDPAKRPANVRDAAAMLQTVLLDATATWRRLAQMGAQLAFMPLLIGSLALLLVRPGPGSKAAGVALAITLGIVVLLEAKFPLGWTVAHKGHRIRFLNHAAFGERLYIDGMLADRGRLGVNVALRGTIESGEGAGERITAEVKAGFTSLSCRLVAEAFV